MPPRVAVIGAGLAGLAAALRLQAAGCVVTVFDPTPPGGKARTLEPTPGWRIEWGPHSFTHRAEALFGLAEELGIADRATRLGAAAGARFLVRGGRLRKAPLQALRFGEWVALVRGLFRRVADVPGESLAAWSTRRFGAGFTTGLVDAMVTGIWATDPEKIEMEAAFPTLARLVRQEGTLVRALRAMRRGAGGARRPAGTYGFPEGMGELVAAAVARLGAGTVRAVAVDRLTAAGEGYRLDTAQGSVDVDGVVLAGDAPAAARLLQDLAPETAGPLGEVAYAPLAVAHWITRDAAFPTGFGFLAAHAENRPILGCIFVSDLYPDRAPAGHRSFATMFGGSRCPGDAAIDDAEARRRIEAEHLALTGRPVSIAGLLVVRHPAAVAPPAPGHRARMQRLHALLPDRVVVAGAWCGAGAMEDAVRCGQAAAEGLAMRLESRRSLHVA